MTTDKRKQGKANRRKGARYELEVIALLRDRLPRWTISDRGFQSRGGKGTADVEAVLGGLRLHVECKTGAGPGLRAALEQADRDRNPHAIPVGVCHWTRGPTLVCMTLDGLVELLGELAEARALLADLVKFERVEVGDD